MSTRKTICFNCDERMLGCHATCEKYIAERKKLDAQNAKKLSDSEIFKTARNPKRFVNNIIKSPKH